MKSKFGKYFVFWAILALSFGAQANGLSIGGTTNHGGQGGKATAGAIAGASSVAHSQALVINGGDSVSVHQEESQRPVSSAVAPSMNPTANCAIPVTGGVSAASLSISGGTAYESDTCVTIEQAKTAVVQFGDRATGEAIMCTLTKYREARKVAGRPCAEAAKAASTGVVPSGFEHANLDDPTIRRRAGLPPL